MVVACYGDGCNDTGNLYDVHSVHCDDGDAVYKCDDGGDGYQPDVRTW